MGLDVLPDCLDYSRVLPKGEEAFEPIIPPWWFLAAAALVVVVCGSLLVLDASCPLWVIYGVEGRAVLVCN